MDRKTIIAMTLCFLIYVGWQKFYLEPRFGGPNNPAAQQASTTAPVAPVVQDKFVPYQATQKKNIASQMILVPTSTGTAVLGNGAMALMNWDLKDYHQDIKAGSPAINLSSVTHEEGALSLAFEDPQYTYLNDIQGQILAAPNGAVWTYSDKNLTLTREVVGNKDLPYIEMKLTAEFKAQPPKYAFVSVNGRSPEGDSEEQDRQLLYWNNQALERVLLKDVAQKEITSSIHYIGATNRYFVMAVIGQGTDAATGLIQSTGARSGRVSMVYPVSGKTMTIPLRVYFGPKELNVLRQVDAKLDHTIDFGWFTVFAYPLLKLMKLLYNFLQNYGLAIIFLTILLKIATYPLTYKSMKSMKKMAKMQPQLQKLREKYKDDKESLNREMLTMMKSGGYNPMAGCIPILIQMPVFFALYRVLYSSIELFHAPFAFWIHDLSSRDPYYVTPVLLSVTMFVQQKLTPNTATDPTQARMMQFMPLIFGAFMMTLPSGLTVYMLVNSLAAIVQQMILNKKLEPATSR